MTTQKGMIVDIETETIGILGVTLPAQTGPFVTAQGNYIAAGYEEYNYPTASGNNEQYAKLLSFFNYFEEYELTSQIVQYIPRWTLNQALFQSAGGHDAMTDNNQILMITDKEDVITRDGNLQEYYQQRMQNGAVKGSYLKEHSIHIKPHMGVAISNIEINGGAGDISANNVQDTMPSKFIPTKQITGLGAIKLSLYYGTLAADQQPTPLMAGWKFYCFFPYVDKSITQPFNYGHLVIKKMYRFRYPDTRAILGVPALLISEAQLASNKELDENNGVALSKYKPMPTLLTMKAEAYAKLSNPETETPLIEATKKRKQAVEDLVTVPVQSTPYRR